MNADARPDPIALPASRRRITLTVAAVMFMLLLDSTILNTSLPAIAAAQGVPPLALSAVITVYLLAAAAVLPLASWLSDRFGLRRVFLVAVGLFTLASLACGLSLTPTQLVLARAAQGLGGGLLLPAGRALAMRDARKQDIIGITALLTWPMLFAPVLGPPLGGFITTYASWRWNFLLNVPIGLVGMLLVWRWVPRSEPVPPRPLDVSGAVGAILGLVLLISGLEWSSYAVTQATARWPGWSCMAAGLAAIGWTVAHLRRTPHPVISLEPFRHHSFAVATFGGTMASLSIQATPFLLPLLFQLGLGRDALAAGALLVPYFLGNLGMKTITTPILRRFGFRSVTLAASACSTLSIAAFALVDAAMPWGALMVLLVVAGCARSMLMTAINTLNFVDLPGHLMGAGSTLSAISMQVASALGVALAAIALSMSAHLSAHARVQAADFHSAFLAIAAVSALGLLQFLRIGPDAGAEALSRR